MKLRFCATTARRRAPGYNSLLKEEPMLKRLMFGAVVCMAGVALAADAGEDVSNATKKLNDSSNYSWKQTTENAGGGGFGAGTQQGKTEKDGYTVINMTIQDNDIVVVVKGSKGALKTEDGWKTGEELAADDQGPGRFMARMVQAYKLPGVQAADTAAKLKDIKQQEDAYVADVSGKDANDLVMPFRFGRRGGGDNAQGPEISNAKATVKFWVKDGVLTKYQVHAMGTISFNGNDRDIDRTTTVEFSDIGSTKVEVPEDAKKKLGQ
jgi:hypothetical protein